MKCLLLFLALELVTSDKLDRTYLPPPGSKYSGGTIDDLHLPLEFPKETQTRAPQNGLFASQPDKNSAVTPIIQNFENEISRVPNDYTASMISNDLHGPTQFPNNRYQSIVPTPRQPLSSYGSFAPKLPNSGYLPSKESFISTQSNTSPVLNPEFEGTAADTNNLRPGTTQKYPGYYYYVPAMQSYENEIINANRGSPVTGSSQYPNQMNNGLLVGNYQSFIPRTATTNEIVQNYQPRAFGFYGGNPMIMTSSSEPFENLGPMTKFGENDRNIATSLINQKVPNNNGPVRLFQTPLVGSNINAAIKPNDQMTTPNAYNSSQSNFSTNTNKLISDKNVPAVVDKKFTVPVRPRFKYERPQAESERNAVILIYENNISPEGYSYSYDTSNGIHADETGIATNGVRAKGSYSYTGDDGKIYTVTYTADENGFQPIGDHIPTAPPVSEAIRKVIEQAAKDKASGIIDDGSYDESKYGYLNYLGLMDRYIPSRKSNIKSRPQPNKQPNERFQGANINRFDSRPAYRKTLPKLNNNVTENPKVLKNFITTNANKTTSGDEKLNSKDRLNTENKSIFRDNIPSKEQLYDQNRRPITSVTNDEITNEEKATPYQIQNSNINNKPNNNAYISKVSIQDQINQSKIPTSHVETIAEFTDDGYYYVPPIIKFNPNNRKTAFIDNPHLTTNKYIPDFVDTEANKRTSFDEYKLKNDKRVNPTQFPINVNTAATEPTTRQPYISGPDEQDKAADYDMPPETLTENGQTKATAYTNDIVPTFYEPNTTPMTTQGINQDQPPVEYLNRYYQSTTNPTVIDKTLPSAVQTRVNASPPKNSGITISQDIVTTTYRPISDDGVLEVNQNVKIYGIGKSAQTTAENSYPDKESVYNNGFYTPKTPSREVIMREEYPDSFYTEQFRENAKIPNESTSYLTTGIPGIDSSIFTGPYTSGFDGQTQGNPNGFPNFPPNIFASSELPSGQGLISPNTVTENQISGGKIIGEDFTGPKQPQKFDPVTGYYYK